MTNIVTVTDTTLTVEPQGLDKLWSFTSKLEIPISHVRGATLDPGIADTNPKAYAGRDSGYPASGRAPTPATGRNGSGTSATPPAPWWWS